ncbi:MAG: SGNH/GDSL hydrolase family protein [Jatrophihabitans sp.]|nr:MAG: SGNH/GDSL hydrolase family protein [Jatrophihabitans sp.]
MFSRRGRQVGQARRIATIGGAGVGVLGAVAGAVVGLILGEVKVAEHRIPKALTDPPNSDGTVWAAAGVSPHRPPIRVAMLGDSLAAGYGVARSRDTPAAQLAIGISAAARRPVRITNVAVVGSESKDLAAQLDRLEARGGRPELAVLMIGANDVTERTGPERVVHLLEEAVRRLRARGAEVVVGTCPDLGTIRPLPQPLRWYARRLSRTMAKEQTIAVVHAGGRTVSLGDLLGPIFDGRRDLFAADEFHPSAAGYVEAVAAILPSCLDALGLRTRTRAAGPFTTRRAKPVEKAAAQAVQRPGSEVAPADKILRRGRGGLVRLRRRRQQRRDVTSRETATQVTPATTG